MKLRIPSRFTSSSNGLRERCDLFNLKEQLGSKYQRMKMNELLYIIHKTILNTNMEVKLKRVYKTTRKNKVDK